MASIRDKAFSGSIHISVLPSFPPERPLHLHIPTPLFSPLFLFFQLLDNLYNTRPPPWTQIGFRCGETESEAEWLENICDALNVNAENHIITSECSLMDSSVTTSLLLPFEVPGMLKTQTQMCLWCATCRVVVVRNTTEAVSHVTAGGPLLVLWWKVT